jgi:hypothetical protein
MPYDHYDTPSDAFCNYYCTRLLTAKVNITPACPLYNVQGCVTRPVNHIDSVNEVYSVQDSLTECPAASFPVCSS